MGRKSAEDVAEQLRRVLRELPRAAAFDAVGTEKQHAGGDVRRGRADGCDAGEARWAFLRPAVRRARRNIRRLVLNTVFGGGITSKLFTKVREELSLCYYAMSSIEKNKGVMIVSSGVEFDKLETAEKEILRQLEDCRNGEISDYEFDSAKHYPLSDLKTALDSPGRLDDYAIGQSGPQAWKADGRACARHRGRDARAGGRGGAARDARHHFHAEGDGRMNKKGISAARRAVF